MEKRKAISIRKYFIATTAQAALAVPLIILIWWLLFSLCIRGGLILPADTSSNEAKAAMQKMQEADRFDIGTSTIHYDYILFDSDGSMQKSSMSENKTIEFMSRYPVDGNGHVNAGYIHFSNGSYCLFIWNYYAQIVGLRGIPADWVLLALMFASIVVCFVMYIRKISKRFYREISFIENATRTIASRNLETEIVPNSNMFEFRNALIAMEEMRAALNDSLKEQWALQQRRKSEIAALAHDLRTPITAINGNAELLLEENLLSHQTEYAKQILTSGERTKHYVEALQQVSEYDFTTEKPIEINIKELLNDVCEIVATVAAINEVKIEIDNKAIENIVGYPLLLSRALTNVLDNAIRYSLKGSSVNILVSGDSKRIVFNISDSGKGFSKEALKHASEMFWKQDETRLMEGHYGFGLAIASRVAEMHKGFLTLSNTERGGRVSITIYGILDN